MVIKNPIKREKFTKNKFQIPVKSNNITYSVFE